MTLSAASPLRPARRLVRARADDAPRRHRIARRHGMHRRALAVGDAIAAVAAIVVVLEAGGAGGLEPLGAVLALTVLLFANKLTGLYDRDELVLNRSTLDELPRLFTLSGLFALMTWLLEGVVTEVSLTQIDVAVLWGVVFVMLSLGRALTRTASSRLHSPERCLVIGEPALAQRIALKMRDSHVKAEVVASIPMPSSASPADLADPADFEYLVESHRLNRVIVAPTEADSAPTLEVVRLAKAAGLHVSILPRMLEVVGSAVEFDELDGLTMLGVRRFGLPRSSRAVKRTLDLAGASLGLIAVAPLLLAIAVAIRLDSRGPILFRQVRIGRDGTPFRMVKFRSMVPEAESLKATLLGRNEAEQQGFFKIDGDPRITRVGNVLRRTSLDELPQLLNVLRGQMSLVGPRPLIEEEDAKILGLDRSRLHLTPGMTGHWQVLGSARIPMEEMRTIDYLYVANWSLWTDVKILLRTVGHVFSRRGV